jgi:hypothetical protein
MKVKKEPNRCRKVEDFIGVVNSTCALVGYGFT